MKIKKGIEDGEISYLEGNECEINIPSLNAKVLLSKQQTTIVTEKATSRLFLKEIISSCLN